MRFKNCDAIQLRRELGKEQSVEDRSLQPVSEYNFLFKVSA